MQLSTHPSLPPSMQTCIPTYVQLSTHPSLHPCISLSLSLWLSFSLSLWLSFSFSPSHPIHQSNHVTDCQSTSSSKGKQGSCMHPSIDPQGRQSRAHIYMQAG